MRKGAPKPGVDVCELDIFCELCSEMLFNSIEYLIFLPVVFLLYWFGFKTRNGKNGLVIAASYLFYGWWDVRFLVLIIFVSGVAYGAAMLLDSDRLNRKAVLWSTVALNLAVLLIFKYFDFFAKSFTRVWNTLGFTADAVTLDIILPVGLSFYIFQALGYVIDVYRGTCRPCREPLAFFAFISFFPQLVAGPIERAANMLPQFESVERAFTYASGVSGMKLILWGLFKKAVVADNAALFVEKTFADCTYMYAGTVSLWIGAILFTIEIYCDFSGYSDIAVGSARLFGINLMQNFRHPFFSKNIKEFWQRWHISLTSWFRDYVYIPLGGNRHGRGATVRNTAIVFLLSGLWHGAALTYVAWGAYHAALYVPRILATKKALPANGTSRPMWKNPALMMGFTFMLVVFGFIFFRAGSCAIAVDYIRLMFSHYTPMTLDLEIPAIYWAAIMLIAEWRTRGKETPLDFPQTGIWRHLWVRWSVCVLLFMTVLLFGTDGREFIYFRF